MTATNSLFVPERFKADDRALIDLIVAIALARMADVEVLGVTLSEEQYKSAVARAKASGVSKATHPWVAFCDDDDQWLPGKLSAQFAALEADPTAVVATTGVYIDFDDDGNLFIADTYNDLVRRVDADSGRIGTVALRSGELF